MLGYKYFFAMGDTFVELKYLGEPIYPHIQHSTLLPQIHTPKIHPVPASSSKVRISDLHKGR